MPFLKNVVKDLVEQRLWPVAVLLVAALVAVPILVGRHGGNPAAAPISGATAAGASPDAPTASKAAVTIDAEPDGAVHDGGRVRDPFRAAASASNKAAAPKAAPAPAPATVSSTAGSASSGSSTGGSATAAPAPRPTSPTTVKPTTAPKVKPATPTPKKTTTAPTAEDASDTYHVSLKVGLVGAEKLKTLDDVARLSPLPSLTDPFFVYLGVLQTTGKKPEKRAVFLVSSDATPNGEGSCHPTKQDCESVELALGETVFFDYTAPNGTPTQYQLELTGIHKTTVTSRAKASAAVARHSVAGAELLRDAATRNVRAAAGARAYRYIPATGLLERAKRRHVTARAAAAGTLIPGLALVSGKHQPGLPVWRSPKKK
jgi:hypothetical protein